MRIVRRPRSGLWVALAMVGCAWPVQAQLFTRPELGWQTVRTPHFDVHFPRSMQPWALHVAGRLESVRNAVVALVGNAPSHRVTVVIDDPYNVSNGAALPVLNAPTIILWPTPPAPSDDIGNAQDWAEVLAVHEFTHIAHLTRPSRNPGERLLWHILPVDLSPIARGAPRWVMEGYATYVEGLLTGSGRPHSAGRAAVLRQWAVEGRLPTYADLNGGPQYLGGDMPYLAGSAFLEWLVARTGEQSLPQLWRRMTARVDRDFDMAFIGVYGDSPRALYGRFTAEVTGKALQAADVIRSARLDSGEVFQHLTWYTGDPAVSHDGRFVAVPVRAPGAPTRVVVWSTAPQNDDSILALARRRLVARDSDDVPAVSSYPLARAPVATLDAMRGRGYDSPRFLADGMHLLVSHDEPRPDGALRPDVFEWTLRTGAVRRITRGAAVRDADPAPDGRNALGVRCLGGICDLVLIDLATGRVDVVRPGSPTRTYSHPRFAPDGRSALVGIHDDTGWHVEIMPVADGAGPTAATAAFGDPVRVGPSDGASRYGAIYVSDGLQVVTISDLGGEEHLELIDPSTGSVRVLAVTTGGLAAPDAGPVDSSVYFLSLSARGRDLHRVALNAARPVSPPQLSPTLAPAAVPPPSIDADSFPTFPVPAAKSYGLGPREYRYLPGGAFGPGGRYLSVIINSSDPVGRLDWTLTGALGDPGTWRGASAAAAWRGLPVTIGVSAFALTDFPSREGAGRFASDSLDASLRGAELSATLVRYGSVWSSASRIGGSVARAAITDGAGSGRTLAFAGYTGVGDLSRGAFTLLASGGALGSLGRTEGIDWQRLLARGSVAVGIRGVILRYTATYSQVSHDAPVFERPTVGGDTPPLTDTALLSQRIPVSALPVGIVTGRQVLGQRLEYEAGFLSIYYDRFTTPQDGNAKHDLYGGELHGGLPAVPFLAVPSVSALLGTGYSISAPYRYKLRVYVALRYAP